MLLVDANGVCPPGHAASCGCGQAASVVCSSAQAQHSVWPRPSTGEVVGSVHSVIGFRAVHEWGVHSLRQQVRGSCVHVSLRVVARLPSLIFWNVGSSHLRIDGGKFLLAADAPFYVIPDASVLTDVRAVPPHSAVLRARVCVFRILTCLHSVQFFDVIEMTSMISNVLLLQTVVRSACGHALGGGGGGAVLTDRCACTYCRIGEHRWTWCSQMRHSSSASASWKLFAMGPLDTLCLPMNTASTYDLAPPSSHHIIPCLWCLYSSLAIRHACCTVGCSDLTVRCACVYTCVLSCPWCLQTSVGSFVGESASRFAAETMEEQAVGSIAKATKWLQRHFADLGIACVFVSEDLAMINVRGRFLLCSFLFAGPRQSWPDQHNWLGAWNGCVAMHGSHATSN